MPKVKYLKLRSDQDGLDLALMAVYPEGEPRAIVQLAHGMGEHKKCYLPFMEYLAGQGCLCVINDHRGHGESIRKPKDLGYLYKNGAAAMVEDLHQVSLWAKKQAPGRPLFLFGFSMGSLAARIYTEKYDAEIAALVVCGSPGPHPAVKAGLVLARLMGFFRGEHYRSPLMRRMTTGQYVRRFEGEGQSWLTADKETVKKREKDPLCGFTFTLNGYVALFQLMLRCYGRRPECGNEKLPIHFCSGADDPCMPDYNGFVHAMECIKKAGYTNVSGQLFEGLRHDILNDSNRQAVFEHIWNEAFAPCLDPDQVNNTK